MVSSFGDAMKRVQKAVGMRNSGLSGQANELQLEGWGRCCHIDAVAWLPYMHYVANRRTAGFGRRGQQWSSGAARGPVGRLLSKTLTTVPAAAPSSVSGEPALAAR